MGNSVRAIWHARHAYMRSNPKEAANALGVFPDMSTPELQKQFLHCNMHFGSGLSELEIAADVLAFQQDGIVPNYVINAAAYPSA